MLRKLFNRKPRYEFSDPENTACIVCAHVLEGQAPILHVTHDADDGMWQFLCGTEGHEPEHAKVISLVEIAALDPTINELNEMPLGVGAERSQVGDKWQPFRL